MSFGGFAMKRFCAVLALIIAITSFGVFSYADDTDVILECTVKADGAVLNALTDNSVYSYAKVKQLTVESDTPIHGIYIKFDKVPKAWTLTAGETTVNCGTDGYLHEFVELSGASEAILDFADDTVIADIYAFGEGSLPSWVQRWERAEKADILVCPTHSDDDQLYFAGLIPWCASKGYTVQVVYLTHHNSTHDRPHELLEGLWHNGVKYYPHISEFPDKYAESLSEALATYRKSGITREDFVNFQYEAINKFKPDVVVGHDSNGEYGHGVHILNMQTLTEAVTLSAERGEWDVPKTYIHILKENASVFNWDEPCEFFGGKTPFEISQEGFRFHVSQQRFESLTRWLYGTESTPITKASEIRSYSPCSFGLFRSTVGLDSGIGDLFENIPPKLLPFISLAVITDSYKAGVSAPLMPMAVSSVEELEASKEVSSESSEPAKEQPSKAKRTPISLPMAVMPFAVVLVIYFIVMKIKER